MLQLVEAEKVFSQKLPQYDGLIKWYANHYKDECLSELEFDAIYVHGVMLLKTIVYKKYDTMPDIEFDYYFRASLRNRTVTLVTSVYGKRSYSRPGEETLRVQEISLEAPEGFGHNFKGKTKCDPVSIEDSRTYADSMEDKENGPEKLYVKLNIELSIQKMSENSKKIVKEIMDPSEGLLEFIEIDSMRKKKIMEQKGVKCRNTVDGKISMEQIRLFLNLEPMEMNVCISEIKEKLGLAMK